MKVGCIQNNDKENQLTVGEMYTVENELPHCYMMKDDRGGYSGFPKSWFIKFKNEEQANLFSQYLKAQDEVIQAESRKKDLFQKLIGTGLNTGEIIYKTGRLRGLK